PPSSRRTRPPGPEAREQPAWSGSRRRAAGRRAPGDSRAAGSWRGAGADPQVPGDRLPVRGPGPARAQRGLKLARRGDLAGAADDDPDRPGTGLEPAQTALEAERA